MTPLDLLWLFLILSSLQPMLQQRVLAAQAQVRDFVTKLLSRQMPNEQAGDLAGMLGEGRWTHDFPISAELAQSFGLKVSTELPDEVRLLMRLHPQPRGRRPSVEYIPMPYDTPRPARPVPPGPAGARP